MSGVSRHISKKSDSSSRGKAFPAVFSVPLRLLLRSWSHYPKAPGYLNHIVERWGSRLATHPLECRLSNGMKVNCDLGDHIQRQIYFRGAYEAVEAYLFIKLLMRGMTVIDAGANVGQYSLIASTRVGNEGQVHAFEPVPSNFDRLVTNVRINEVGSTVRTIMKALWYRNERVTLTLPTEFAENKGAYRVGYRGAAAESVSSTAVRLDDYVQANNLTRVDVIKMDIEGAELFALQGAEGVLSQWHPIILVEINSIACRSFGYDSGTIGEFLKRFGYRGWVIGVSPETSRCVSSIAGVFGANAIFHTDVLPDCVTAGWSYKSALRYHARRMTRD